MYAFVARIRSQTAPKPLAKSSRVERVGHRRERGRRGLPQRTVGARVGNDAAAVVHRHVENAVREVAEVVGEIGVVPLHHLLVREVAVGPEALIGHEVIAEAVDAEVGDEVGGRDLVQARLAHLLAADEQPAVREHAAGRLEPGRHQHRRPVHRVETEDVLADEVVVDGPPLLEARRRRWRTRPRCSS